MTLALALTFHVLSQNRRMWDTEFHTYAHTYSICMWMTPWQVPVWHTCGLSVPELFLELVSMCVRVKYLYLFFWGFFST